MWFIQSIIARFFNFSEILLACIISLQNVIILVLLFQSLVLRSLAAWILSEACTQSRVEGCFGFILLANWNLSWRCWDRIHSINFYLAQSCVILRFCVALRLNFVHNLLQVSLPVFWVHFLSDVSWRYLDVLGGLWDDWHLLVALMSDSYNVLSCWVYFYILLAIYWRARLVLFISVRNALRGIGLSFFSIVNLFVFSLNTLLHLWIQEWFVRFLRGQLVILWNFKNTFKT